MTVLNPEHLFEQAERLVSSSGPHRPRDVDLRRAISAAYYAVFHAALAAAADQVLGRGARSSTHYGLVYRSVDHRKLRELCKAAQEKSLAKKYQPYVSGDGFGPDLAAFAEAVVDLQLQREAADYDPLKRFARADARLAIKSGRSALQRFEYAGSLQREAFLHLLLFQPRS